MTPRSAFPPRVYIHTLGCPKNEADSRGLIRTLQVAGAVVVSDPGEATHILVNTCGFIQDAKEESIAAILDACAGYQDAVVAAMGCLVQRYPEELREGVPEVAGWFGLIEGTGGGGGSRAALVDFLGLSSEEKKAERRGHGEALSTHAYLKVSDGCDEPCTFCAIPGIKGRYYAVDTGAILADADACLSAGVRELILVGQDTALWEHDGLDLRGLVDALAEDERVTRIRVMYLQPDHVTDRFLEYMAGQPKLCRYLDVPFQHSHPEVLRRMGRSGDGAAYLELIEAARRLMPDVSVRSTFIVGFPGETEEHFEHLLAFADEAGFDHAGGFVYSPEGGTPAAGLRPRVRRAVARDRLNRLNAVLAARAEEVHRRMLGARVDVLVDLVEAGEQGEDVAVGRTCGQAPDVDGVTYVEGALPPGVQAGDLVEAVMTAAVGFDMVGIVDAS